MRYRHKKPVWVLLAFSLFSSVILLTSAQSTPASELPLLSDGTHIAITFSDTLPESAEVLTNAYVDAVIAGARAYELNMMWSDLEPTPNNIDTSTLESLLIDLSDLPIIPYFVIKTIDTVTLSIPNDLVDPNDPTRLANNMTFDDPIIMERWQALMDEVIPLLVEYNGFFIAVANEADIWLQSNPDQLEGVISFVEQSREYIHGIESQMAVGINITYEGIVQNGFEHLPDFMAVSDAVSFSYYPLNNDMTPQDPSVVLEDIPHMVELAGDMPILLQEIGYPSGYLPTPSNESSVEMQAQFVTNVFDMIMDYPQIRFVSFQHLADWSDAECDAFTRYYGSDAPRFREFLCSLGYHTASGEPKPAFDAFMDGLAQMN